MGFWATKTLTVWVYNVSLGKCNQTENAEKWTQNHMVSSIFWSLNKFRLQEKTTSKSNPETNLVEAWQGRDMENVEGRRGGLKTKYFECKSFDLHIQIETNRIFPNASTLSSLLVGFSKVNIFSQPQLNKTPRYKTQNHSQSSQTSSRFPSMPQISLEWVNGCGYQYISSSIINPTLQINSTGSIVISRSFCSAFQWSVQCPWRCPSCG